LKRTQRFRIFGNGGNSGGSSTGPPMTALPDWFDGRLVLRQNVALL
jgi:hypothetical protein